MKFHNNSFHKGKFIILAQVFFHNNKLKIADIIAACKTIITAHNIYFIIGCQVFHYFSEHQTNPGLYAKT